MGILKIIHMKESNNSIKIVAALLTGAVIGGVFGILLTPQNGNEARGKIAKKSSDIKEVLKEKFNDMLFEIKNERDTINEKENELKEMDSQSWRS